VKLRLDSSDARSVGSGKFSFSFITSTVRSASAKSSLDEKEGEVRSWAAQVLLLDRTLAEYGPEIVVRAPSFWHG